MKITIVSQNGNCFRTAVHLSESIDMILRENPKNSVLRGWYYSPDELRAMAR
jgi:hypothetical protein